MATNYLPPVSVVIPTYMEEKYIEQCLKSIKNQNYRGKIEIIVADSNSPDKTRLLAKKYADKVINIKERGIAKGRNAGWRAAHGEIIIFADGDTKLGISCVKKIVNEFSKSNVVSVCPKVSYYDGTYFQNKTLSECYRLVKIFTMMRYPMFPCLCAAYRKDILEKVNGQNENIKVGEDIELTTRVKDLGKCVYIDKTLSSCSARRLQKLGIFFPTLFQTFSYLEMILLKKLPTVNSYPHVEEIENLGGVYTMITSFYSQRKNLMSHLKIKNISVKKEIKKFNMRLKTLNTKFRKIKV